MERIQTQANLPTTPVGLKEAGNDAINKVKRFFFQALGWFVPDLANPLDSTALLFNSWWQNNFTLAVHMYTLGIDLASQGLPRNEEGVAASPDLWKRNQEQVE